MIKLQSLINDIDREILLEVGEYRIHHTAPTHENGTPLHNLTPLYPEDIYGPNGAQYYGHYGQNHPLDMAAVQVIRWYRNKPNAFVKIYRAVPSILTTQERIRDLENQKRYILKHGRIPPNVETRLDNSSRYYDFIGNELEKLKSAGSTNESRIVINPGDWVTINRAYAKEHGEAEFGKKHRILTKTVHPRDLFTIGDSIQEWGYDPQPVVRIRPVKNLTEGTPTFKKMGLVDGESINEYIKGHPLIFQNELRGSSHEQKDFTLWARDVMNKIVGRIDYSVYNGDIQIQYIDVEPDEQRKSIATLLAKKLQKLYPGVGIDWGMLTAQGSEFLKKLPRYHIPDKEYLELTKELENLREKEQRFQKTLNDWYKLYDFDREKAEKLRPTVLKVGAHINSISDRIWKIEQQLQTLKSGKWLVNP